eukprot:6265180-Amphidinium_carterae.2
MGDCTEHYCLARDTQHGIQTGAPKRSRSPLARADTRCGLTFVGAIVSDSAHRVATATSQYILFVGVAMVRCLRNSRSFKSDKSQVDEGRAQACPPEASFRDAPWLRWDWCSELGHQGAVVS